MPDSGSRPDGAGPERPYDVVTFGDLCVDIVVSGRDVDAGVRAGREAGGRLHRRNGRVVQPLRLPGGAARAEGRHPRARRRRRLRPVDRAAPRGVRRGHEPRHRRSRPQDRDWRRPLPRGRPRHPHLPRLHLRGRAGGRHRSLPRRGSPPAPRQLLPAHAAAASRARDLPARPCARPLRVARLQLGSCGSPGTVRWPSQSRSPTS